MIYVHIYICIKNNYIYLYNNFYTWIDWINKFTNLIITNTINIINENYVITFENKIEKQYIYKVKKQTIILAMYSK